MSCWPANFVSAFFVALLIFDLVQKEYDAMPGHIVVGFVLIILFFVLCWILGDTVTGAILVVPAVVLVIFLAAVWFTNKYQTPKTASGPHKFKGLAYLVRKDGACVDSSAPLPASENSSCVVTSLNATTIS